MNPRIALEGRYQVVLDSIGDGQADTAPPEL
jgi:hypothetical protein